MSTRGSFILHKKGTDKELKIRHDAYPDGVGLDIVELIKTVDIRFFMIISRTMRKHHLMKRYSISLIFQMDRRIFLLKNANRLLGRTASYMVQ